MIRVRHLPAPLALALLLATPAYAQTEAEMKRLAELDRVCEAARETRLAPMRRERIERCVTVENRPREQCTAEYAHWGDTQATARGAARAGMFYDLPECVTAFEARKQYRR
ncbi:MAG: hypothetical protein MUC68_17565 [Burkholderiaceae bacterium]|jgi:hypothetical protein|nr:hypothetical protein [Burkholderiaceae bacterium]